MIDPITEDRQFVEKEFTRMGFDKDSTWRISDINKDFELCNTYPRFLILPYNFKDSDLDSVAKFRYFRRVPTAVWRHIKNGCFIVRSSQPTVGWFGWFRNDMDENLVQSYVNITIQYTKPTHNHCEPVNEAVLNDSNGNSKGMNNGDRMDKTNACRVDDPIDVMDCTDKANGYCCDRTRKLNRDDNIKNNHSDSESNPSTASVNDSEATTNYENSANEYDKSKHTENLQVQKRCDMITNNHGKCDEVDAIEKERTIYNVNAVNNNETEHEDSILSDSLAEGMILSKHKNLISISETPMTSSNGNGTSGTLANDSDLSNERTATTTTTKPINNSDITADASINPHDSITADTTTIMPLTVSTSKMLIIDARSYAAAMANRAKGGGCECSEYYLGCEVHFMNLANIHSIRKSYHAIRSVCEAYSEQSNNWVSFLDNSRWLHHISGLLKSALLVVEAIDVEEKSIMIHCSDGWDRTPQLVALAEIMLDPHYRTFDGFQVLIQREWLDFGHKFADRCGSNPCNEDPNERCPVFLQWLDCVQQLLVQYPKHFEFNSLYLDKLNRHTYSNVFGTFSYNSTQERLLSKVDDRLLSLWSYFNSAKCRYRNDQYVQSDDILRPSFKVKDLHFWKEVYLPPMDQPKNTQAPFMPITNNIDNNKCSQDSLFIDGLTNRTVCK